MAVALVKRARAMKRYCEVGGWAGGWVGGWVGGEVVAGRFTSFIHPPPSLVTYLQELEEGGEE